MFDDDRNSNSRHVVLILFLWILLWLWTLTRYRGCGLGADLQSIIPDSERTTAAVAAKRGSPADAAVNGAVRPSVVQATATATTTATAGVKKGKAEARASGRAADGRVEVGQGNRSGAAAGTAAGGIRPISTKATTSASVASSGGRAGLEAAAGELRQAHAAIIAEHSKLVSQEVALQCGERDMEVSSVSSPAQGFFYMTQVEGALFTLEVVFELASIFKSETRAWPAAELCSRASQRPSYARYFVGRASAWGLTVG